MFVLADTTVSMGYTDWQLQHDGMGTAYKHDVSTLSRRRRVDMPLVEPCCVDFLQRLHCRLGFLHVKVAVTKEQLNNWRIVRFS